MADLKYYDGTNWVTLKGSGVALSTVGVDMTDCDLTPDGANGAFTADGSEADGTQKYKLDLNLPRGAVVTESADQPATESSCAGDIWIDPTGDELNGGDGTPPIQSGGRLTLVSNSPVYQDDAWGPTLYYTPYTSDTFSVYDPDQTLWVARIFPELSIDVSVLAADTVHDLFISYESDNWVMTPAAWTNDRTRSVGLSRLDGVLVSGSDVTKRWVGTFRTNSVGHIEQKKINNCLWNVYNQVQQVVETRWLFNFAYATQAWIPYASSVTNGQARVSFVVGANTPITMIGSHTQKLMYSGVVLDDLSEPWNGGAYMGTPGHNGSSTILVTTPGVDSQVSPAGYNFVQSVVYGINGNSSATDMTIQGVYFG